MTYQTSGGTGSSTGPGEQSSLPVVRKLNESQGARSQAYELADETGRVRLQTTTRRTPSSTTQTGRQDPIVLAKREHVNQLIREARQAASDLWLSSDSRDIALAGNQLTSSVQSLWQHREVREEDWRDAVNLLQIGLAKIEFERLSDEQRRSVARIFEDRILERTVGRTEIERILQLAGEAGLDVWRGVDDVEIVPDDPHG